MTTLSMASRYGVEPMRAVRRRGWILACYSLALLVSSLVLVTAASDRSWRIYGIGCLLFGVSLGARAAGMLVAERPGLQSLPGRISEVLAQLRRGARDALVARDAGAVQARPAGALGGLPGMGVTQARVIRAEWTKLHSLRSTAIVLGISLLLIVGLGVLLSAVQAGWETMSAEQQAAFQPAVLPLAGVGLAQLSIGILGVLCASGEYSSGLIRSTLSAVPRRTPVLWAKLAVLAAVVGAVGLAGTVTAFFLGQAFLAKQQLDVGLGAPGALGAILGGALVLILAALMGSALGMLLRSTALGISAWVGLLFVLPIIAALLPGPLSNAVGPYLFDGAAAAVWSSPQGDAITSPLAALIVACSWTGVAVAAAAYRLLREDS